MTRSAPPAFLAAIPTKLLVRQRSAHADLRRANDLVRHCEQAGYRPSFLELDVERNERKRARR